MSTAPSSVLLALEHALSKLSAKTEKTHRMRDPNIFTRTYIANCPEEGIPIEKLA
jgi:hypothetical protein